MARPMPPVSPCAPWPCSGTSTPTGLVRAATTRRGARRSTTSMASSITPTGSTTCSSPPPWEGENYEPRNPMESGKRVSTRTHCIRYADDCVIFHNTWEGIQRCKEAVREWLKGMGLELKDAKTHFAHTLEEKEECGGNVGFDFLGFTVRQSPVGKNRTRTHASYKTII